FIELICKTKVNQFYENLSYFLSVGISIPIFNGFTTRSNIQRSIITKDRATINDKDVKYQLWTTIEQAYTDVKAAVKSYEASQKAVDARKEAFRVIQQRKLAGAVNATDYEIAQNNLAQAENDLTRAKYDYIFKLKLLDFYQGKELKF
ncbi:MAG: TolC family protein, partial [Bacteroidota bacterium]